MATSVRLGSLYAKIFPEPNTLVRWEGRQVVVDLKPNAGFYRLFARAIINNRPSEQVLLDSTTIGSINLMDFEETDRNRLTGLCLNIALQCGVFDPTHPDLFTLRTIEPSSRQELPVDGKKTLLEAHRLASTNLHDGIFVVGTTGSGKSTLVNFLCRVPLVQRQEGLNISFAAEDPNFEIATIGHAGSETIFSKVCISPDRGRVFVDTGGLLDQSEGHVEIAAMGSLHFLLNRTLSKRLIFCCEYSRILDLHEFREKFWNTVVRGIIRDFNPWIGKCSLVITKIHENSVTLQEIVDHLSKTFSEDLPQEELRFFNSLTQAKNVHVAYYLGDQSVAFQKHLYRGIEDQIATGGSTCLAVSAGACGILRSSIEHWISEVLKQINRYWTCNGVVASLKDSTTQNLDRISNLLDQLSAPGAGWETLECRLFDREAASKLEAINQEINSLVHKRGTLSQELNELQAKTGNVVCGSYKDIPLKINISQEILPLRKSFANFFGLFAKTQYEYHYNGGAIQLKHIGPTPFTDYQFSTPDSSNFELTKGESATIEENGTHTHPFTVSFKKNERPGTVSFAAPYTTFSLDLFIDIQHSIQTITKRGELNEQLKNVNREIADLLLMKEKLGSYALELSMKIEESLKVMQEIKQCLLHPDGDTVFLNNFIKENRTAHWMQEMKYADAFSEQLSSFQADAGNLKFFD